MNEEKNDDVPKIDKIITALFEIRTNAANRKSCEECETLKEHCRNVFTKYNKGLSLVKNIERLKKDLNETNKKFNELNTKFINYKSKYEQVE